MILTNYFVHGFLIMTIIIFYILIAYYNFNAVKTELSNRIVQISGPRPECNYKDISIIPNNQKCTKGDNKNRFYIILDKTTYLLSTIYTNYHNVCKTLCSSFDSLSASCTGSNIAIDNYNKCIQNLIPAGGCNELEKPLGFRIDNNTNEKVNFYAKDIVQINSCI